MWLSVTPPSSLVTPLLIIKTDSWPKMVVFPLWICGINFNTTILLLTHMKLHQNIMEMENITTVSPVGFTLCENEDTLRQGQFHQSLSVHS